MLTGAEVLKKARKYDFPAVKEYLEHGGDTEVYNEAGMSILTAFLEGYYTQVFDNDPDEIRFYSKNTDAEEYHSHVFKYCRMPLEDRPHPIKDQVEWLMKKGIGINAVGWKEAQENFDFAPYVETPLMQAVTNRDYCMTKYLLENGADPTQKLFTDGNYDRDGFESWLIEDMDINIVNGDIGDSMMLDLEIASILMHYGLDQWEGGLCIEVDHENRRIRGHGLNMQH